MTKLLLYFVKIVNAFTNDRLTAEKEADVILKYLLFKSDPLHTLDVNEALQRKLKAILLNTRKEYSIVCEKIDKNYPPEETKIIHKLIDIS